MSETLASVYSDKVLSKAELLAANKVAVQRDAEDESVWWVKGSGGSKYRVQVLTNFEDKEIEQGLDILPLVSCSCPNGQNRGGRPSCYHSASVLIVLENRTADEHDVMEDPNPLNEDFVGDDERVAELRAQGYTDTEIEFLRS